jgi:hypothetical protein
VLALNQLSMHADCVMPIENQALADICKKVCDSQFPCMIFIFNDIQNSHRIDDADSIISAVCDRGTRKIRRARAAIRRGLKLMPM